MSLDRNQPDRVIPDWNPDGEDPPARQCPQCGLLKLQHLNTCDCGWDLRRTDGDKIRSRSVWLRVGAGALLLAIAIGASILRTAASESHIYVYLGAIATALTVIVGGVWYAFDRPRSAAKKGDR